MKSVKTTLTIKGTHCASCKALIEEVSKENPCVFTCEVNFTTGTTIIEHKECLNWEALKKEIESLGEYQIQEPTYARN